jgi:hypothetical protein
MSDSPLLVQIMKQCRLFLAQSRISCCREYVEQLRGIMYSVRSPRHQVQLVHAAQSRLHKKCKSISVDLALELIWAEQLTLMCIDEIYTCRKSNELDPDRFENNKMFRLDWRSILGVKTAEPIFLDHPGAQDYILDKVKNTKEIWRMFSA